MCSGCSGFLFCTSRAYTGRSNVNRAWSCRPSYDGGCIPCDGCVFWCLKCHTSMQFGHLFGPCSTAGWVHLLLYEIFSDCLPRPPCYACLSFVWWMIGFGLYSTGLLVVDRQSCKPDSPCLRYDRVTAVGVCIHDTRGDVPAALLRCVPPPC